MLVDYAAVEGNVGDGRWSPLKIVARMGEPIVCYDDGMHLDGILAYGAYLAMSPEGKEGLPPITSEWAEDFELPLAKWALLPPTEWAGDPRMLTAGGLVWGWCASAADVEWLHRGKMEFRRRPAVWKMARYTKAPSHHLGAGAHKAYNLSYPSCFAREVRWHALGDKGEVEALLSRVRSVGKKGALGMGKVLRWTVLEEQDDKSIACDGELTRRIPRDGCRPGAIRAPYHHRSRVMPCARPGDLA